MSDIIQKIQFKRGTKENLQSVLTGVNILTAGEPAYETDTKKIKVGDGLSNYADLPYIGDSGSSSAEIYVEGYYLNNKFYTDSTYQTECEKNIHKIYINLNYAGLAQAENFIDIYRYVNESVGYKPLVAVATDSKPGLVKLYATHGENEDGAMTQKSITDAFDEVKFAVSDTDSECLILNKGW